MRPPRSLHWLFWDVDTARLDVARDASFILGRVLEFGRLEDIKWLRARYGLDGIHAFLRDEGHSEISKRTLSLWRAALGAKKEIWANKSSFRETSVARWRA